MVLWCFVTPRVSRSWQHHVSLFRETREIIPTKVTCADMFITCLAQCKELQLRYHPWCLVCLTWCGGWSPWWFQLQRFHSWMPPWTPASAATWTSPFKLKDTSMTGAKMWVPRPVFPPVILQVFQSGIQKTTSSSSCQILPAVQWLCHLNGSSLGGPGSTSSWPLGSCILSQWTSRNRRSWNWSVEVCWM